MTGALRQSIPLFLRPRRSPFTLALSPSLACTLERRPPSIAQPPYSSVLNATTRGTFLPSLFSLSSQCRFAVSRGEVVERRKREGLGEQASDEEKKRLKRRREEEQSRRPVKEGKRQARYRRTERPQRGNDQEGTAPVIKGPRSISFLFCPVEIAVVKRARVSLTVWRTTGRHKHFAKNDS